MRDNIESNYLIFISSDGKREGYEIFKERIKNNMWPIYNKTPQLINIKKIKKFFFTLLELIILLKTLLLAPL